MNLPELFARRLRGRRVAGLRPLLLSGLGLLVAAPVSLAQRMVVADATASPVAVDTASISSEVTGRYAVTTFDLVFRNPNNRPLEGTFEFPLLEGQNVIRFALDIDGRLREAVPVEKQKGRVAFEEIARRGVDPGLLEKTAGNNYRARIFPLPAQGSRRIVIAYQEELARDAGGVAKHRIPLDFADKLARFDLAVAVCNGGTEPAVVSTTLPFALPNWDEKRTLHVTKQATAAQGVIELSLPPVAGPAVVTEKRGGREYFSAEVALPDMAAAQRPAPKVVGILWDASGSGRQRDHAKEFAFLEVWFRLVPEVEVRLVRLHDAADNAEVFAVCGGDWSALRQALEKVIYDGATSLDGLKRDRAVEEWLLFSDGLFNFGAAGPRVQLAALKAPVHAVVASVAADATGLRSLSRLQGGELANLLAQAPQEAALAVRALPLRVWDVDRDPQAVAQVFPESGAVLASRNLVVTGLLRGESATVSLRIGRTELEARTVEVAVRSGEGAGTLAARAWAAAKIDALSLDAERNRDDIRRTSEEYGIATSDTSLIVLETVADYLQFDIAPPEELRAEWKALRRQREVVARKDRDEHLDEVVADFEERVKWWEKKPAKTTKAKVVPTRSGVASTAGPALARQPAAPAPAATAQSQSEPVAVAGAGGGAMPDSAEEEVIVLSPFEVTATEDSGYVATTTLAGTRIRTTLRDIGSAVSVVTPEMLRDIGATDNESLLQYTASTEAAGVQGNFAGSGTPGDAAHGTIKLQAWAANAGYLDHLRRVTASERYAVYLEERADHLRDVGFYLDVGGFFLEAGETALGVRILSNLAEFQLEDAALLRVLGHRLMQAGQPELARPLFEQVLKIRGEEPQSRRDLALACAALKDFQRAIDLLWQVVENPWHDRFPGIELLALGELNSIAATCGERVDLAKVDGRLRQVLPVGLRVVLTWDSDAVDIDLWVDDPDGERAIYSHQNTVQGGLLSCDFQEGYGPEEFLLRRPKPGNYTVRINYFGDRRNTARGLVTAQLRIITGYGTPEQKEKATTVQLGAESRELEIGSIEIPR